MSSPEDYLYCVEATVRSAADWVTAEGIRRVRHLVEHGEPAEGLCSLAWIIVNEKSKVPIELNRAIRAYSEELVAAEFMPPNLDEFAMNDDF